jgi:hypothetical protein
MSLTYIVIDQDGDLAERTAAEYTEALAEVGPEGWNRVQLTRTMAAWVNDCGLILDKYRRNPIAGVLLMCLGAQEIPYAGPVVLTGWDARLTMMGEAEVIGLTPVQVDVIRLLHSFVRTETGTGSDVGAELVALAGLVRDGQVPGWTVHSS